MAFLHYDLEVNSTELAEWLRKDHSVFILAGGLLRNGQLLPLGSASRDLIESASESLAGRIHYLELTPFLDVEMRVADVLFNDYWICDSCHCFSNLSWKYNHISSF